MESREGMVRQPLQKVENILRPRNRVLSKDDEAKQKEIGNTSTVIRTKPSVRNFAPSKLDTTRYHQRSNGANSSSPSSLVFPQAAYRVVIYNSSSSSAPPLPIPSKTRPNEVFLTRLNSVMAIGYPLGTGYLDIRGAIQEGDAEWTENLDLDHIDFTDDQVKRIRVLIMPRERYTSKDEMGILLLGNQFHRRHKNFTAGFSYHVLRAYDLFKDRYAKTSTKRERFNMLFGFTFHLHSNDWWMTHHGRGWGGEAMVARLARHWKQLLQNETSHLGLDTEFSYPAVKYFLEDFKRKVEQVEMYGEPPMKFAYWPDGSKYQSSYQFEI